MTFRTFLFLGLDTGDIQFFFSDNRYETVGVEISENATAIAKKFDPQTTFINGSVMEMDLIDDNFDAIYCFNVLHLFQRDNRLKFLKKCYNQLNPEGFIFFTVFSEEEASFGKGKEIEKHTFESKPGRPVHYFSEDDLIEHFKDFKIIETGILEEPEDHGENGAHTHILRYFFGQKLD